MFYSILLSIHVGVAVITGIIASYAGVVLWQKDRASYRPSALILGALAGFEILSGTILSIASSKITALSLCSNIVLYLSVVFIVEALLFLRMKKVSVYFPITQIVSPALIGLVLFVGAIAYGF